MSMGNLVVILSAVTALQAINRPVYKVVLTQNGYAQFLQYDVETPPLREFTFCTWIRVYDLGSDQSIFTYFAHGNNRIVRLWLESEGQSMKISINGKVTSSSSIDIVKDVWRHVCLSYQSDFGAWALYIDSRLISCEAAQSLYGFVLPGGGSVIIGYGTADNGAPNGFEGEIFGANMILKSTIERNHTTRTDPFYDQKQFSKNKLKKDSKYDNYIVLSDLMTDEIHNNFEKTYISPSNITKSYIKFHTPHTFIEHSVGTELSTKNPKLYDSSIEKEIFDFTVSDTDKFQNTERDKIGYWNIFNHSGFTGKIKSQMKSKTELSSSSTRDLPTVSEYETPPPENPPSFYFDTTLGNRSTTDSLYNPKESTTGTKVFSKNLRDELSEVETPPPLGKNTKVYGQWTSSKFAGSVLNYLKKINFHNRERDIKKAPPTIPLNKISDAYPYASGLKFTKLRPPLQFSRRNLVQKYDIIKRDPQINVQILEDDLRSNIIKMHAQAQPKKVEITNRGKARKHREHRFYRNVDFDSTEKSESYEDPSQPRPFTLSTARKSNHRYFTEPASNKSHKKLLQYTVSDSYNTESQSAVKNEDMYLKSLSGANKWHNSKSYSNDYTPTKINMESEESNIKKQHPAVRLKYVHEKQNILKDANDPTILKGRKLALDVSDQSTSNKDAVSILTYNHGYLPSQDSKTNTKSKLHLGRKSSSKRNMDIKSNFNSHIKIGNALNERHIIGVDEKQKKKSFVGGLENIPDINQYRSDLDNENGRVPASLGPRVCKDVELYDRVLYVQQDESIDMTHILSPVREKNIAIEFILQNYKKCSLSESYLRRNPMLYIDWSRTPVRLFGGAYPKTTTDLCGFF